MEEKKITTTMSGRIMKTDAESVRASKYNMTESLKRSMHHICVSIRRQTADMNKFSESDDVFYAFTNTVFGVVSLTCVVRYFRNRNTQL